MPLLIPWGGNSHVGVEQRRNRKLIQKPKFRFLDQTFGFCRFRFRRKQKDSGEESRKIIFFAFILESESKILNSDFWIKGKILFSLSKINPQIQNVHFRSGMDGWAVLWWMIAHNSIHLNFLWSSPFDNTSPILSTVYSSTPTNGDQNSDETKPFQQRN